ncbi:Uncharacterized protein dnl_11510 [Desulfonema limicola]|uniref:Uncharacterized protein n=1 Tax=Desulfonema limicola TaxID=45656 RepID=A0A975B510_9BACT|nr:Uncharacterized protein dnl_11510 [Desulfonema limicola]
MPSRNTQPCVIEFFLHIRNPYFKPAVWKQENYLHDDLYSILPHQSRLNTREITA